MVSVLMAVVCVCLLALAVVAARTRTPVGIALAVLTVGLAYDNGAIAVGTVLGYGDALEAVNVPRYWIHALFTPLLIVVGAVLARRLGVSVGTPLLAGAGVLAAALVVVGLVTEAFGLHLKPETYADALRYVHAEPGGPPLAAIATIVVLGVVGAVVWRKAGFPWLFAGAVTMFVAAGVGFAHFWISNLGELALQTGIVATLLRSTRDASVKAN
ncbi:hypothetical protein [Actinocorallia sp. A-T 12471]|uniref:hypothetical protein n=1 Tax=Actinocorallia sp. A-T 12471 TaxID=3089813 RepID=UPI0029CBF072|nr:hypothetical protein [Actinocorallia sp. A-T 12471]MDX6741875.1 hypothetical protein [Actinocorallia sp. A-T 12471]